MFHKAAELGMSAISFTDHDTVDGCIIAQSYVDKYDVDFINGIELSCFERGKEYHILGYNFDLDNKPLRKHLVEYREMRLQRAEKIIKKLAKIDISVSFDAIVKKAGDAPITRPHIASALLDKGYISTLKEAFNLYLGEGKPAYQEKSQFSVQSGIQLLNNCGGVAVLAHPGKSITQENLYELIEKGLDGIECIHPTHDESLQRYYRNIASQYWLLETGGSDYHGTRDYDEGNFGRFVVPYTIVDSIRYHSRRK